MTEVSAASMSNEMIALFYPDDISIKAFFDTRTSLVLINYFCLLKKGISCTSAP